MLLQYFAHNSLFKDPKSGTPAPPSPVIVWIIGFFAFLDVYAIQAILPMIQHDFETTTTQAGIVVGVTLLAMAMMSPFMGMISDRIGRKNVLCFALVALAIPTALIPTPLCTNVYVLMVLRFCQGLAVPGIVVVTMAYIAEEFAPANIARITTAYVSGTVMGGFFGRFITGHVSDWIGWRGGFGVLAVINLVGVVLIFKKLPPSQHFKPNTNFHQGMVTLGRHLKNPKLLAACAVGFCVLYSLVAIFTYVNFLLAHEPFNLSSAGLANVFCVYLIGVLVTPMAGRLISKLGNQRVLILALAFAAVGISLTLITSMPVVIFGLIISSSSVFICQSSSIGFIAANVSEGRSLASGLYSLCYYAGGAVGTLVAGIAFEHWGWPGSVCTIVMVQIIAAIIAWTCWGPTQKNKLVEEPPTP